MVHRLLVSFGRPEDPGAFDDYYRVTHAPLAMELPGLLRLSVGHPQPLDPAAPGPYMVAELDFASEEAMGEALASNEGRAAGADLANFATGGATLVHFDVREPVAGIPEMP
ncbi:EthD family reductase [Geodermatophilus sp. SYSU D00815]